LVISIQGSIKTKAILILLIISLVPILILSIVNTQMSETLRSDFISGLGEQFDEKDQRLQASINQRIFEMDVLSHHILFQELISDLPNIQVDDINDELTTRILYYAERTDHVDTILEIKIFDNGAIELFSLYNTHLGSDYTPESINKITDTQITFDFDEKLGRMVTSVAPMMNKDNSQRIGLLLFVTDMGNFDPILLDRSGLKETGEAYFVNSEKLMVSESRFMEDAAFNQRVDTFGVRECLENNSEVSGEIYDDYRGESIIGYSKCMLENDVVFLVESDVAELTTSLDTFQQEFFLVLGSTGIATLFASLIIGAKLSKPIKQLSFFANQISNENFDEKVEIKSKDELGRLGKSMNEMAAKLKQAKKDKEDFVAMLSHDLKQPLVPIQGNAEMLGMPQMGELNEMQKECVAEIAVNVSRQLAMIDNLVSAQKLGAGAMVFDVEELSSKTILKECIKTHSPAMMDKKLEYFDSSTIDVKIKGDKRRILEAYTNLILNAHDFVPEKGKIEIGVNDGEKEVTFFCKDNGEGIPKDKQDKLFKKYGQVKSDAKRKYGGTGLGLAISQELVEGMKGKVWLESEVGKGTTFFFTIPKAD